MRLTTKDTVALLELDESAIKRDVSRGVLRPDERGCVEFVLAHAYTRLHEGEAWKLFGERAKLPAMDMVWVRDDVRIDGTWQCETAATGLLDLFEYGIDDSGRRYLQAEYSTDWLATHKAYLSDSMTQTCVLLRNSIDLSTERALMDAYLLGDVRVQYAVEQYMGKDHTVDELLAA